MTVNQTVFNNLIEDDIEWLLEQKRTLERDHILECLEFLKRLGPDKVAELEEISKGTMGDL